MRGLVKWVWRRKIILTAASSIAGLVVTARRKARLAEAAAPAVNPTPRPAPLQAVPPAPESSSAPAPATPTGPAADLPAPKSAAPAAPSPEPATSSAPTGDRSAGDTPVGAVPARADGSAPSGEYVVKAKLKSKIFHTEASPNYTRTKADVWFRSAADAEAAGFRGAKELKRS